MSLRRYVFDFLKQKHSYEFLKNKNLVTHILQQVSSIIELITTFEQSLGRISGAEKRIPDYNVHYKLKG